MSDFTRPRDGFRFRFGGMKLSARPDALPPNKYALAVNVREYEEGTIRCRPGLGASLFAAGGAGTRVTDIRAYAGLNTDNLPRIVSHISDDTVWVDTIGNVGSLAAGSVGGASMIPFRPNASPHPYMYIANGKDYQKFSAPSPTNVVRQFQVGMPEPQQPPEAAIGLVNLAFLVTPPVSFAAGGTAGAPAVGTRVTDTVGTVFGDPAGGEPSFSVGATVKYQQRMVLSIGGNPNNLVRDVVPPLINSYPIAGIFYFVGTTGRCIIVTPALATDIGADDSIYRESIITTLRRGAIIKVGAELAFVRSVTRGSNGSVAIETSTTNTHAVGELITGVPTLRTVQLGGGTPIAAQAITEPTVTSAVTAGIGTLTRGSLPATSPFALSQPDDYISFGLKVDNLANLSEMKVLFDVSDGTFTKDFFYYTVRPSDIQAAIANVSTQLSIVQTLRQRATIDEELAAASGNQQAAFSSAQTEAGSGVWSQIVLTLRELTRVGSDATKNLQTVVAVQFLFNASGTINVEIDQSIVFFGGSPPDVGSIGAPYLYRVRPRSTITGVKGNPSPATRYGVNPRRESVSVTVSSVPNIDNQMDTMDVFRYGGTVTSWRWIGEITDFGGGGTFTDVFGDDAATAGEKLEFDNFEPWPSVGLPSNGSATITGVVAVVTITDPNVLSYLPGTLIQFQVGSPQPTAFTLRTRPTLISGNNYLFELIENAGTSASPVTYAIQEPLIARQKLPYMWGPDANGTVFACGDSLRPGTLYFCKSYVPDSAPDSYNQEIVQPAEPLLGGEIVDGVSFAASTERWWRLYFQPENLLQRFSPVQEPDQRGLAAPFGHCNDGRNRYWWAKDGIWSSDKGSLTDEDLYILFPHEGVNGQDVIYNGITIPSPDYSQVASFRLTYSNGFLYAIYRTANLAYTNPVSLVLNLRTGAWDFEFSTLATGRASCAYHVEQQKESSSVLNPVLLFGAASNIYKQTDLSNDGSAPIPCNLATAEYDGGDVRAPKQWGDYFLDLIPAASVLGSSGVSATPTSLGVGVAAVTVVSQSTSRSRNPISIGGTVVSDFMGLFLSWTDDFTRQSVPTQLFVWQPSFDIQPARAIGWKTFGTSFGMQGYGHIRQVAIAWVSTAPITLTVTSFDGQSPQTITIPSSGGTYQKQLFPVSANKGQLYIFQATSTAPFQIFEDDIELHVGAWARSAPYQIFKSFGGSPNAQSPI